MRLRRADFPGVEVWNACTGCLCHEMPMVFDGESGCCDECGCPKTEKSFTLAAKPIADSRKAWDRQKTKEA